MSAYKNCKWCDGDGCNQCHIEREKDIEEYEKNGPQPMFTAKQDNPNDRKLLKEVFGMEALEHAFGEGGEGMEEIELNAAIASLKQVLHTETSESGQK